MADQPNEQQTEPAPKKGLPIKTIIILAVFLVVEAATVLFFMMAAGSPSPVQAENTLPDDTAVQKQPVEELLIKSKFVNTLKGETIIYDTQVYVVVRRQYQDKVRLDIEEMKARINTDIANIIRRAPPSHFSEPTHATLARQIKAALDKRLLAYDEKENNSKPVVMEVLISRLTPYKANP